MAKSDAQRQIAWRKRHTLRSRFFEIMDINRRHVLDMAFLSLPGEPPYVRIVRDFFLAYPGCLVAPEAIERAGDRVVVRFGRSAVMEPAAAAVALEGAATIEPAPDEAMVDLIRTDVEDLRDLGLWRS